MSLDHGVSNEKIKKEAKVLMNAINSKMKDEFERYKEIHYNPNTKGADYEKVVTSMLKDYISSMFNFHQRAQLIDAQMKYLEILEKGSNEIDVVATFKNASPNLILKIQDTDIVPYDAVAFVVEVKALMDKSCLAKDLDKLEKLARLPLTENRFGVSLGGQYNVQRPLRILFYFDISIDSDEENRLLLDHYSVWDAIYVLQKDVVILNPSLPVVKAIIPDERKDVKIFHALENPFVTLLLVILASTPTPFSVNVMQTFINLDAFSKMS